MIHFIFFSFKTRTLMQYIHRLSLGKGRKSTKFNEKKKTKKKNDYCNRNTQFDFN